jgi:DNA mismatch repair protein MutS
MHLSDTKSSFIFATHLHEIVNLDEIKERDNIKAFHLTVDYDSKLDALIYDRILKEGNGEKVYGVTVAKSIIHDAEFIENAVKIKNRLLDKHDGMLSDVTSNYNAQKVVFECEICGKRKKKEITNLETHHINFQKDFDKDGLHKVKSHIHKNAKYNLMVLCDKCHDKIHNGEISIESVKMTNRGKKVMVKKQNS